MLSAKRRPRALGGVRAVSLDWASLLARQAAQTHDHREGQQTSSSTHARRRSAVVDSTQSCTHGVRRRGAIRRSPYPYPQAGVRLLLIWQAGPEGKTHYCLLDSTGLALAVASYPPASTTTPSSTGTAACSALASGSIPFPSMHCHRTDGRYDTIRRRRLAEHAPAD